MKYFVSAEKKSPVEPIFEKQQEQGKHNRLGTFGGKTHNYIEPINCVQKRFCVEN